MDGVEFMPANKNVLFGFNKSICGIDLQPGPYLPRISWLPAMLYLAGCGFTRVGPHYTSTMVGIRKKE
jgi:carbon starvation protein CstA